MVSCIRCFLNLSVRIVNLVVMFCGIGMIIHSLWLLKQWKDGFIQLGAVPPLPKPWFIYTCMVLGIVVCLSMLTGHSVIHCITFPTLAVYMFTVFCILVLEVGLTVSIFFKMNWQDKIPQYVDSKDEAFEEFLYWHLTVCCLISIIIIVAQVKAIMLMVILRAIGPVPRNHCHPSEEPEFKQSFLVRNGSPVQHNTEHGNFERNSISEGDHSGSSLDL